MSRTASETSAPGGLTHADLLALYPALYAERSAVASRGTRFGVTAFAKALIVLMVGAVRHVSH